MEIRLQTRPPTQTRKTAGKPLSKRAKHDRASAQTKDAKAHSNSSSQPVVTSDTALLQKWNELYEKARAAKTHSKQSSEQAEEIENLARVNPFDPRVRAALKAYAAERQEVWAEQLKVDEVWNRLVQEARGSTQPPSVHAPTSAIEPPATTTHGATMAQDDDRIITKHGTRYFPVSLAAEIVQAPRTTLHTWIRAKRKFVGRPLDVYKSPTAHRVFLSQESVERLANRFVSWPSQKPVGRVTVGETDDGSGYIGIAAAARNLRMDHHTLYNWIMESTAPTEKPLDVIKCTATDMLYIAERDVAALKKVIPRSGLRPGRRHQLTPA